MLYFDYLECDECDECGVQIAPAGGHTIYYWGKEPKPLTLKSSELRTIETKMVWCRCCNTLTLAERIYTAEEWEEIATHRSLDARPLEFPISKQTEINENKYTFYYYKYLNELMEYYAFYSTRKNRHEACLVCGGYQYYDLTQYDYQFRHTDCSEGRLQLKSQHYYLGAYIPADPPEDEHYIRRVINKEGEFIGFYRTKDAYRQYWELYEAIPESGYLPINQGLGLMYQQPSKVAIVNKAHIVKYCYR